MISEYKQKLKELKISHREVADRVGHSRETVTLWLLGLKNPPLKVEKHVSLEIDSLIASRPIPVRLVKIDGNSYYNLNNVNKYFESIYMLGNWKEFKKNYPILTIKKYIHQGCIIDFLKENNL